MQDHLCFQLYGPMQAWGAMAVGEIRPVVDHPTRSGVLGLLAACLGLRREEEPRLQHLRQQCGLTIRVDAPGRRMTDYHTIQTPKILKRRTFYTRRDELGQKLDLSESPSTILSRREYLADALFTACVWLRTTDGLFTLEQMRDALRKPKLTPYLGRKSCPPGIPFHPMLIQAADPMQALEKYSTDDRLGFLRSVRDDAAFFSDLSDTLPVQGHVASLRDEPLHFGRRQFTTRKEAAFRWKRDNSTEEADHVHEQAQP
jgi:CRISPR system Cascade subunit CasD